MLRLKVWTTIPGQRNTHYFLVQGISLLNMCCDFYPWLWLYKYDPPFANWPWIKHLRDAVDRERWMILCILQQTPRAELWRLGNASVLGVWLRRNCSTAVPAGTLLKRPWQDMTLISSALCSGAKCWGMHSCEGWLKVGARHPSSGQCMTHFGVHPKSPAFDTEPYESLSFNKYLWVSQS